MPSLSRLRRVVLLAIACLMVAAPARAAIDWTYVRPGSEPTLGDWFRDILGLEGFGKTYAVIVGINAFRHFDPLDATANDPDRLFAFLRDEMKFDRILVLRNRDVTYLRLRTLFEHDLPQVLRPEDRFLFYWSGHGTQFENARGVELGYLPLVDSPRDNKALMVSMRDLSRWDGELSARHALFLLDACFSGLAGHKAQSDGRHRTIRELARPGHHIISAGGEDQQTIASRQEWQGSIFTHALLKALRGDADRFGGAAGRGDGVITLHELTESIAATVEQAKADADWNRPLRPVLNRFHGEGQFFFLTSARIERAAHSVARGRGTRPPDLQSQAISPALQERDLALSRDEKRLVQGGLNALGHDAGVLDGILGSRTRAAIRGYQVASNAEATGYLSPDQAKALIVRGREGVARPRAEGPAGTQVTVGVYPERPGETFKECDVCPEMVVIPPGSFTMGSPESEEARDDDEGPPHRVTIARTLAVGRFEVTRREFAAFFQETGHDSSGCERWTGSGWKARSSSSWRNPGFAQSDNHPATCVSWDDAKAYVKWLARRTGQSYRLLNEAEWEYVARAGTQTPFSFGRTISPEQANYNGNYSYDGGLKGRYLEKTASVGSYPANAFGVHDMHGNVWEWTEDCWYGSYSGAPTDGSAWTSVPGCRWRVLRGGSWTNVPWLLRSANRYRYDSGERNNNYGFRVARILRP